MLLRATPACLGGAGHRQARARARGICNGRVTGNALILRPTFAALTKIY
jgi:hypothetical protein